MDFLAAAPADRVVRHWGERLHPATALLQNETAHFEGWAADHELHAFNALWDMDEIMTANFMTFADVVERERYDLWVGDEGWDLDYFLHENPDLKRAPYVFLTDFIGVLPMREDRSSTEFIRCWEKNAENIDHLRLHPDVRDRSILVGDEDDVLDREFGPDLPNMRQWAREHFRFSGYTYHFDPAAFRDRAALRRRLGYREDERVILASVGGTRVGRGLLEKCAEAFSLIAAQIPETRMVLVGGPRRGARPVPASAGRGPRRSCRISSSTTRPPTWRSCRAGSPPRWSWPRCARRSSTSRSGTTSSSSSTWPAGSTASGPGSASTTTARARRPWAPPSSSTWASRSTPRRCRSTAPTAPRASSRSCCRRSRHARARAGSGGPRRVGRNRRSTGRSTAAATARCSSCPPGSSSTAGSGRCRSRTSRGTSGRSPSTRRATAARIARPAGYGHDRMVDHARAVLDAAGVERASVVGLSRGTWTGALLAARHPERVERLVLTSVALDEQGLVGPDFFEPQARYEEWGKYNAHYWRERYPEFVEFFVSKIFTEPHSTKAREDGIAWGLETTPEILIATIREGTCDMSVAELLARVRTPTLIVHGVEDAVRPVRLAEAAHAALPGSALLRLEGSGHCPQVRDPVRYNLAVRDFLEAPTPGRRTWRRAAARPPRVLFVSSPIGLGHSLRDVAIARELRALRPEIEIHWLAQDPVTRVLEARGERVHPASRFLAGESAHVESEAGEHDLHVFQAWRNMDEILLANFMVLHDLLEAEPYDLVVGDEAWEIDHFLHENPELKRAAFAWITDFVGWLPMDPRPGGREALLAADYNAEMIEQVARFPRVRDRALFVGDRDDVVDRPSGPGSPASGSGRAPITTSRATCCPSTRPSSRTGRPCAPAWDSGPDERVVLAAVGGTAVGRHLLGKVLAAGPEIRRRSPETRLIVVTGPRIDPAAFPPTPGVELRAFVPDLYAHLAGCDLAIVQGGLSTCMELTATKRPFLYFPLQNHFEQNVHVPHRLARYRAGVRMDYAEADPETLAHAVAEGLKHPVMYRDVDTDGARRAAELIAPLLGARR